MPEPRAGITVTMPRCVFGSLIPQLSGKVDQNGGNASYKFSVIRLMKSFIAEQCGCYPSPH